MGAPPRCWSGCGGWTRVAEALLDAMARRSAERVAAIPDPDAVWARARATPPAPALSRDGFVLIAEVKRRAPSVGALDADPDPTGARVVEQALTYARAGASAVSVLTEPDRFDGALAHLGAAAAMLRPHGVPAMRKDFLVHPVQVAEARACGAGGVLVIVRMLSRAALEALLDAADALGMWVLVECFDAADAAVAAELFAARPGLLVGVNTRDLRTLQVVGDRLARLAPHLPPSAPRIAESGLQTPDDVRGARALGYTGALVGSALMSAPDPEALCRALREAGDV